MISIIRFYRKNLKDQIEGYKQQDTKANRKFNLDNLSVIIDRNNHIRGYYNGAEYLEVKEMIDAIKVLKAEEFIPKKNS